MQPIHFAAAGGHVDIIDALVTDHKVDPNIKVNYLHTYVHFTCMTYTYSNCAL